MPSTAIVFPDLPTGLASVTAKVISLTSFTVLETVALTGSGENYDGNVTGPHAGTLLFKVYSGAGLVASRIRTIANDAGPYVIMSELESLAFVGSAAYVATLTVDDGTDPVASATIRISGSGVARTVLTDGSGVALAGLENGAYDVTVLKAGFVTHVGTLTVAGATSATYTLTPLSITPPAAPGLATGYGLVYDEFNELEINKPISVQMVAGPGDVGNFLDTAIRTVNSDADGYVEFTRLRQGATYNIWRGPGSVAVDNPLLFAPATVETSRTSFVVPYLDDFALPEVIGADA